MKVLLFVAPPWFLTCYIIPLRKLHIKIQPTGYVHLSIADTVAIASLSTFEERYSEARKTGASMHGVIVKYPQWFQHIIALNGFNISLPQ